MNNLIRVALIDDHWLILDCLSRLMAREPDIQVTSMTCDSEGFVHALESAAPCEPFDVMVLDLSMPYHGFEVLARVNQLPTPPRVLILTGHADSDSVRRAVMMGAHGLIQKSDSFHRIIDAIRQVARGQIVFPREAQRWLINLPPQAGELSAREVEVLQYVARGMTNSEIAHRMQISRNTVGYHLKNIFCKLGVSNRTEATVWYFSHKPALPCRPHADGQS